MRRFFSLLFLFGLLPLLAQSGPSEERLSAYFEKLAEKGKAMGSFSISKDGKPRYQKAFGYASLQPMVKADTNTVYQVGSISKTFTAAVILQMTDEGKLRLEDPLSLYFKGWADAQKISIEHLLRHRSGIHNFGVDASEKYRHLRPETREEVISILSTTPLDWRPGEKHEYNNVNYVLLSLIAEGIDSLPFSEIIAQRITTPLGLNRTAVGDSIEPLKGEARSFYKVKKKWKAGYEGDLVMIKGAGAIVSTPTEVNRFLDAVFSCTLFTPESLRAMVDLEDGAGLGVFGYPYLRLKGFGHGGNIGNFRSFAVHFPEKGLSITLCLNAGGESLNKILKEALQIWFEPH